MNKRTIILIVAGLLLIIFSFLSFYMDVKNKIDAANKIIDGSDFDDDGNNENNENDGNNENNKADNNAEGETTE